MVWFYQCKCLGSLFKGRPFNPTMVWFYQSFNKLSVHYYNELSIPLWSDFIKSEIPKRYLVPKTPFNPTMVWFYQQRVYGSAAVRPATFNPTMVWFYHLYLDGRLYALAAFNPTMVWFYLAILIKFSQLFFITFNPTMVWFYPVLIKKCLYAGCLSIPLWSDFINR